MDVAARFRRLGLALACQLLFCHLFTRVWRLGLQSRRDIPCRIRASPECVLYFIIRAGLERPRDAWPQAYSRVVPASGRPR